MSRKKPNIEHMRRGLIPWSTAEYRVMEEQVMDLLNRPRDDWDRTPRSFTITGLDPPDEEPTYRFNVDKPGVQVMGLFSKRYGELGPIVGASHWARFDKIVMFVTEHQESLALRGLIEVTEHNIEPSDALLDVVTDIPYRRRVPGRDEPDWTFDFDHVMLEVERRRR